MPYIYERELLYKVQIMKEYSERIQKQLRRMCNAIGYCQALQRQFTRTCKRLDAAHTRGVQHVPCMTVYVP